MAIEVNVTHLRQHLSDFLDRVGRGEEILVTSRGIVVARLMPPGDFVGSAQKFIEGLREKCWVGDVESPIGEVWEASDAGP